MDTPRTPPTSRPPLAQALQTALAQQLAVQPGQATLQEQTQALSLVAREQLAQRWVATQAADTQAQSKRVYYLSMEFLMGRSLSNALDALNLTGPAAAALQSQARDLEDALAQLPQPQAEESAQESVLRGRLKRPLMLGELVESLQSIRL